MYQFLTADINFLFSVSLLIVFSLALIEISSVFAGISLFSFLDDLTDIDASSGLPPFVSGVLGWLCIDRLPLLVWLILFLSAFSLTGLAINVVTINVFSFALPQWGSVALAVFVAAEVAHFFGNVLAKVFPKSESSATSSNEFEGLIARITVGTAAAGSPAEAVLTDSFGQKHYVMVQPSNAEDAFQSGTQVVLVEKSDSVWAAIPLYS